MFRNFFKAFLVMIMPFMNASADFTKEDLCKTSPFVSAKISPDGSLIAQIGADHAGILNLFIYPADKPSLKTQISFFNAPEIIQYFWSADSKKVLVLKDENGTGQLNLHGFDVSTKAHLSYTEHFPHVNTKVIKLSPKENKAVVGLNTRHPHFHDLYVLDLNTGKFTLLLRNDDGFAKFLASDEMDVVLKMSINEDGSWSVFTKNDQIFMILSSEAAFQTEFLSYDSKANSVYLLDNRYSDTNRLMQKSLEAPYKEKVLGSQSDSDVDDVLFVDGAPKAYATYYLQKRWHVLDPSIQGDFDFLNSHAGSNFEVISKSSDNKVWTLTNSIPDQGEYFWIYDRDSRTLKQLSPSTSEAKSFSKMYEMVVTTRDGKKLVCYYTLPKEYDKGGTVDSPIPLVVVPHGGPFKVRDKYEFYADHQWLSSLGYAALSVNFRLSSGFGKSFVNAGNGEWGGKAHLDVIDAVEACIAKGITKRSQLAIFGGSYGGYESLAALTLTPDYFTCCVSICGPSNLKTVLDGCPQFWELTAYHLADKNIFFTKRAFITSMGGDPEDPKGIEYLEKCSPLNYLDRIQVPLLLIHGKNDQIVRERESRQIYESMKKSSKKVTYIVFPNEGHRIAHSSNKLLYLDHVERFLAEHLHGKYQPASKELTLNSTGNVFY